MNLLRAAGRAALGAYFIANGVATVKEPDALVDASDEAAQKLVANAQRTLPDAVAGFVPEQTSTIVRASGALGILGGLSMMTGICTRKGGALAALSMAPTLLDASPKNADDKKASLPDFLTKVALTGAAMVVSQDTRGRPSLTYSAARTQKRMAKDANKKVQALSANADQLDRRARRQVDSIASTLASMDGVAMTERATRQATRFTKRANKQLDKIAAKMSRAVAE